MKTKIIIGLILMASLPLPFFGQTGYEFWFAAPAVTNHTISPSPLLYTDLNIPIRLYCTTSEGPASVTIEQPANPTFAPIIQTVNNNAPTEIDLTPYLDSIENKPANTVLNRGLRITSDKRINVIYEVQSLYNAATYTLGGKNALGYEFIIPAQCHFSNYQHCDPPARNVFDIVATEDSTTVQIVPKRDIIGHNALDSFSVILNRGQTWSGRATSRDSTAHIGGSFLFSDKPIAVTITDDAVFHPDSSKNSMDIMGDQLIPRNICGTEYIVTSWGTPKFLVYAFETNTTVTLHDTSYIITRTINRGDSAEFQLQIADTIPVYNGFGGILFSDKPVLVLEYSNVFTSLSDQSYQLSAAIVPPANCTGTKRSVITCTPPGDSHTNNNFEFTIITKNGNQGNISHQPNWFPLEWQTVAGTNGSWVFSISPINSNGGLMYDTYIITSTSGKFQLSTHQESGPQIPNGQFYYKKFSFLSDYSKLFLGPDQSMCPGDSILLDAGPGRDSYLWNTGDTISSIWVKLAGTYWVQTSEPDCQLSDTVLISYYFFNPINLGQNLVLCTGDSVQLDAGPGRSWYLWNTGDTTQTIWVNSSGKYWVSAPDIHCLVSDTVMVVSTQPPVITTNPLSKSICSGESTSIQLASNLPGTDFTWTAIGSSPLVSGYGPGTGDTIDQVLTNNGAAPETVTYTITPYIGDCQGDSVEYVVTVTPGDSVMISISSSADSVCEGTQVTFNSTTTNGGSTPVFQWKVDGLNQGTNDSVFTYAPVNGDNIICVLTSSNTICITNNPAPSNAIVMTVYPILPISVTVTPSENPVCDGESVTFTASAFNKGISPVYQWVVNGVSVGINDSVYTYTPASGDHVSCILTSSEQCTFNNPATSDSITMIVNPLLPVGITITPSANPICGGIPVTFTGAAINGGSTPVYQWQVNGINAGMNNAEFTYILTEGDFVTCILTSSETCTSGNPASSNTVNMTVIDAPEVTFTPCFDTITTLNAKPFKLKGGIPLGGLYSGPGVDQFTGYFNPAMAGIGIHQIEYRYINFASCSDLENRSIQVLPPSLVTCGTSLIDIRDNTIYPTVQIGSQCWMAVNLNYGDPISSSKAQRDNCQVEKYCFNDLFVNCQQYGALYQWDELMRHEDAAETQGLCPSGWHVPSETDWDQLFAFYQGNAFAGSPLLYSGYSGFNAQLAGIEIFNKSWEFEGFTTFFWSSTSHGPWKAWGHGLNDYNHSVSYYPSYRANAFSVRCVRD